MTELVYHGRQLTLSQLTVKAKVCRAVLEKRLRSGWPVDQAVDLPASTVLYRGEPVKLVDLARAEGLPLNVLRGRVGMSLTADEAVDAIKRDVAAGQDVRPGRVKRDRVYVEYDGRQWTVAELARHLGMKYITLRMRLRKGWSVERAVAPVRRWRTYVYRGRQMSVQAIADEVGVQYTLLSARLASGMSIDEAVEACVNGGRPRTNSVSMVEYRGELISISDLAKRAGIAYNTLVRRLCKDRMPLEEALKRRTRRRTYTLNGERVSVAKVASMCGVSATVVYLHLHEGWSMERVVSHYTGRGA